MRRGEDDKDVDSRVRVEHFHSSQSSTQKRLLKIYVNKVNVRRREKHRSESLSRTFNFKHRILYAIEEGWDVYRRTINQVKKCDF